MGGRERGGFAMFDVGAPELLVIAIVMILVVGPKDLPKMLRAFGKTTSKIREMAGDFRRQFDEAMREAELDDVKNTISSVRNLDPLGQIKKELNPLSAIGRGIRDDIESAVKSDGPAAKPMEAPQAARAGTAAVPAAPVKGPMIEEPKPRKRALKAKAAPDRKTPAAQAKMTPAARKAKGGKA
jgi:sec-independent protein translocase protein TatB